MGGTFGALGIITALYERKKTGRGNRVISTLYEAVVFMVAQHMAWAAINKEPSVDFHFQRFCDVFDFPELEEDERLATDNNRVAERSWLVPKIKEKLSAIKKDEIIAKSLEAKIPFAPLTRPDQLFDDPHLNESDGLVNTTFPGGIKTKMPKIPLRIGDYNFNLYSDPPEVGQSGKQVLMDIGFREEEIDVLTEKGIIAVQ